MIAAIEIALIIFALAVLVAFVTLAVGRQSEERQR